MASLSSCRGSGAGQGADIKTKKNQILAYSAAIAAGAATAVASCQGPSDSHRMSAYRASCRPGLDVKVKAPSGWWQISDLEPRHRIALSAATDGNELLRIDPAPIEQINIDRAGRDAASKNSSRQESETSGNDNRCCATPVRILRLATP